MNHAQYIIGDITYEEAEEIIDGNMGTKAEWLEDYGEYRNRLIINYVDEECLCSALRDIKENYGRYEEV